MAKKHPKHISRRISAEKIKAIIKKEYEPGRQDKCKLWVYRNYVFPATGISERTFWRYQKAVDDEMKPDDDPTQLKLFE